MNFAQCERTHARDLFVAIFMLESRTELLRELRDGVKSGVRLLGVSFLGFFDRFRTLDDRLACGPLRGNAV